MAFSKFLCDKTIPLFSRMNNDGRIEHRRCLAWYNSKKQECKDGKPDRPSYCEVDHLDPCAPHPKVLIVGAGLAGLACAHKLYSCGLKDITICEASVRPGGRMQSCVVDSGNICDFGSQWIQGAGAVNPLYSLANTSGVLGDTPMCKKRDEDGPFRLVFMKSDGTKVNQKLAQYGYQLFRQILGQARELYFLSDQKKGHGTLYNFIEKRIKEEVAEAVESQRRDLGAVMYGLTNGLRKRWGADVKEMSAAEFGAFVELSGPTMHVPSGMVTVLGNLLERLPKEVIHYQTVVEEISWGGENSRAVIVSGKEDFLADHVVVTAPLGHLKAKHDKLFSPKLPKWKTRAIENLGFGKLTKIFLKYECPFWPGRSCKIDLSWAELELSLRDKWYKGVSRVEEVPGTKDMLVVTVGGPEAVDVEKMLPKTIGAELTVILRQFCDLPLIPYPTTVVTTKWNSDPFYLGTNTYLGVKSKSEMICDLAKPLHPGEDSLPKVMFAGEATSDKFYGTLQGAYLSGLREADRILTIARNFCPTNVGNTSVQVHNPATTKQKCPQVSM